MNDSRAEQPVQPTHADRTVSREPGECVLCGAGGGRQRRLSPERSTLATLCSACWTAFRALSFDD